MSNPNRRPMTAAEYRAAQAKAMTEAQLLASVRKLAEALSWRTYHTHRSDRSPAGFPDLVLVRAGRLIFAELKTERGKTTEAQDEWLDDLEAVADATIDDAVEFAGAPQPVEVHLWRPTDLLDGTIGNVLRADTPPGLASPPRVR